MGSSWKRRGSQALRAPLRGDDGSPRMSQDLAGVVAHCTCNMCNALLPLEVMWQILQAECT